VAPAFPLGVEVPEPGGRLRDHPVCSVWRQSPRCRSRTRSCRAVSLFTGRLAAHSIRPPTIRPVFCLRPEREPQVAGPRRKLAAWAGNRLSNCRPTTEREQFELLGVSRSAARASIARHPSTLRTPKQLEKRGTVDSRCGPRRAFDAMDLWTMGTDSRGPPLHVRLP
jgi:hypothetical protein